MYTQGMIIATSLPEKWEPETLLLYYGLGQGTGNEQTISPPIHYQYLGSK
jgi:hypothetical protein